MGASRQIVVPYTPRTWAETKLHNSLKRWFSLIIHRRGGKTTGLINHLQRAATDDEREVQRLRYLAPTLSDQHIKDLLRERGYGIIYPHYNQAKTVAWDMLKYYSAPIPGIKLNEQELQVRYPGGHKLRLFGADNPQALRGFPLSGVAFDEYSQQPPNVFSEVISKSLADHLGFGIFAGTVIGKNQLYKTNKIAKANPDEWDYVWQDIDESLRVEKGATIETLRRALEDDKKLVDQGMMSQEEYDQEWYLSTDAAIKGAYYAKQLAKARTDKRIGRVPYDELLPVHTWWDLGIGDATAILFFQHYGKEWRLIDSYQNSGEGLAHYAQVIKQRDYYYGNHYAPHDIEVKELGSGKSRLEIAQSLGLNFKVAPKLSIEDGINAARMRFGTLWIDEDKNQDFLHCLSLYRKEWDDKRGEFKNIPFHDFTSHFADAFRYWAVTPDPEQYQAVSHYQPNLTWR